MDDPQAQAADEAKTAADLIAAGAKPQLNVEETNLEQLDKLFTTGSAELPHTVSGGEPTETVEDQPARTEPEPGAKPADGKVEEPVVEEEVVETRSPEEIEQAKADARERVKAEGGDEAAQETAAEEAGKPVKAEVVEEPVVEEEVTEEEEDETPASKSKRFRVKDPMAQAALELYRAMEAAGTPISLAEAEKRVKGPEQEAPKVEPPVDFAKVVTDLEAEVADIERKMADKGKVEGNYDEEAAQLSIDHHKKLVQLENAKRDMQDAERQARADAEAERTASEENRTKAHKQAIEEFPDVVDKTTPLGKAVTERIAAMKKDPKHPDRPILFADSAPLTVVRMVAAELGIAPVAKKTSPPAKPKVVAPLRKVVTPAPGGKSSVQAPAQTPEEAKKKTVEYLKNEASLEELDEFYGMGDPSQVLAGAVR
jgi:hypothetical protein